jgi:localization factor PodJL
LSRTIEGLEARIEGLMGGGKRSQQPQDGGVGEPDARHSARAPARPQAAGLDNPLAAIRERQRMLGAGSEQAPSRIPEARYEPAEPGRTHTNRLDLRHQPQRPASRAATPDSSMHDIASALVELRQQLKQDISEGVSREMTALRAEIRSIKAIAEEQHMADDLRGDLARLADSINQLGHRSAPEAQELRQEFEDLRVAMGGLAREDSIRRIEDRWSDVAVRMQDSDPSILREELISLAYRIEDIKAQLGAMADNPVVHALEQKLITIATAMEQLGSRMQPNDQAVGEQFALLDERLDEISRAIAAGSRATAAASIDHSMLQRLEGRIGALAEQIDHMSHSTAPSQGDVLSRRIEALAGRMEEMAEEQAAMRLEERLEQLSALLQQTQRHAQSDPRAGLGAELGAHLADISRKIDNLEQGSVSDALAERLDYLATRIDGLEFPSQPQPSMDSGRFGRIEDRLSDIAARLDQAAAAPRGDEEALRSLEDQIAHLSSLISQPTQSSVGMSPELETRMVAIENYMATNDEYIIEAARQAAEAVVDAYSHTIGSGSSLVAADMAALTGLAEDLRHLEDLTRASEERTHHTFEALHSTLVQIADRLDGMDHRFSAAPAYSEPARRPEPALAAAERVQQDMPAPALSTRERLETSAAYGHADDAVALAAPDAVEPTIREPGKDAAKGPKPSLLQEISRRLRPGTKNEVAENTARAVVDPAPSIDPSDALPPERENDLLEPGTGAPDVKKILERVRASQAAGEFATERAAGSDRADYIAAARRAAKAAAQETDPSQNMKVRRDVKATSKVQSQKGLAASLSQHRRPILMAVGAVLLVLMAMPLVRTLTSPSDLAPPAAVEAPTQPQRSAEPQPQPEAQAETQAAPAQTPATTPASPEQASNPFDQAPAPSEPAKPSGEDSIASGHLTDPQAADGRASTFASADAAPPANDTLVAPPKPEAPAAISVPAGIAPKSLADAAASGDANALFEIGTRFTEGRGVTADPTEAAKWYKLAADKGFAPAQYRYANVLEKGTGVARDLSQAADYYRKAAEAGNVSAMHNLAVLYASGATGQPDYAKAVQWFSQAADHGVADSQFNLAILFARGNGVRQDLEQSYKWFAIAAKGGDKDAAEKRDEVAKAMRKDQLDSARAKVDQWQVQTPDPKANAPTMPDEWASAAKPLTTGSIDMEKAIRNVQAILKKNGFDAGTPDGKMGQKTIAAIKSFQTSVGQEPTGKINDALVKALLARNT